MLSSPVFLSCCSTGCTQEIRRFLENEKKLNGPAAIQICSTETLTYSPIYVTSFISYDTDTWQCFWLITFVLGCFALVLFFGFLFSTSMLGCCAHMYTKEEDTGRPYKLWMGATLRSCAVQLRVLEELCTFVFTKSVLYFCVFIPLLATCLVLVWSLMFWFQKPWQGEASASLPCQKATGIQEPRHAVGGPPPPLPPPPPRPCSSFTFTNNPAQVTS